MDNSRNNLHITICKDLYSDSDSDSDLRLSSVTNDNQQLLCFWSSTKQGGAPLTKTLLRLPQTKPMKINKPT
jgi:hypothetical protein